mmetsp:Transcript_53942/g.101141  ORF Transcript_53942/g.101141 Transcript_53942/m.101141 type:complete len:178 (-) Transcript_53942:243-776(-)
MGWAKIHQAATSSRAAAQAASLESLRLRSLLKASSVKQTYAVRDNEAARLQSLLASTDRDQDPEGPVGHAEPSSDDSYELVELTSSSSSARSTSWKDLGETQGNGTGTSPGDSSLEEVRRKGGRSGRARQRVAKARRRNEIRIRTPSPDFFHASLRELNPRGHAWGDEESGYCFRST